MTETQNCGICLELLQKTNVCVTSCGHTFCLQCIIKSTNYNNGCPYCRTTIIEKTIDIEEDIENQEDSDEEDNVVQYQYGRIINDCYYFPMVIEDIQALCGVIRELTNGTLCSDNCKGWILGILSIISDMEESTFNFTEDKNYIHNILEADHNNLILMDAITIYQRSIILKKHLILKYSLN